MYTLFVRPPPTAALILPQEDPWPVSLPYFLTASLKAESSTEVHGLLDVDVDVEVAVVVVVVALVGIYEGPPS